MDEDKQRQQVVLVVEDDVSIQECVTLALEDQGYTVVTAEHGIAALAYLREHRPTVILLDMRMPVMDGWTFAREYKERPGPRAPIVVMTAAMDAPRWAGEIGAADVLPKPFDLDELFVVVQRTAGMGATVAAP